MSTTLSRVEHLAKRFFGSLSRRPPPSDDEAWARSWLLAGEVELWERMGNPDRRHVIDVARRFEDALPAPVTRPAMAGALLHDIGKVVCGLGTYQRVLATVLGPGHSRGRYACYHRHEAIGAELCAAAGSDPLTVALVGDEGREGLPDGLLDALHAADDI